VLTGDGRREIIAVDGGFLSVADNRVSVLSAYAQLADEITMPEAERELRIAEKNLNEGEVTTANQQHFNRATAQLKAAQKVQAGR
jgi:F-type H+-transporting ATPase subunit epsilon